MYVVGFLELLYRGILQYEKNISQFVFLIAIPCTNGEGRPSFGIGVLRSSNRTLLYT